MSVQVRSRRESAAFLASYVGAQGEILVDTTNNRVQVHDGTTPGGAPAAKLSEVITNTRTAVADAGYSIKAADRLVAFTALTAARIVTLPAASSYPAGTTLTIIDEAGTCSASIAITLAAVGPDTINGAGSASIATAFGYLALESDGASKWTIIDQVPAANSSSSASTAVGRTPVNDANYTALAADRLVAFTALTAARAVTLPAASTYPAATTLRIVDESGAASSVNAITIARAGSDTIDGISSATIASPYGVVALESNGTSRWTIVAQVAPVPARSTIRQTVQAGPVSGRLPSFLPATSSSLALTAQNISSPTPLTVAAAQGFGSAGQIDTVTQLTANPTWSSLVGAQTVSSISATTSVATVTTASAHNLVPGATITISGASQTAVNGIFLVATVPSATTFTIVGPNPQSGTAFTAGTVTGASYIVTNFLALNAQTGAAVSMLLPPIYQFGGTPSAISGQFTFDYQAMVGALGNGSAAVQTPLVSVGEATVGASAIASTAAYAYDGVWDSGWIATLPAVATGSGTLTHNIGIDHLLGQMIVACTAADTGSGFAVGDTSVGILGGNLASSSTYYVSVSVISTRLTASFVAAQNYALPKKTTGVVTSITAATNFKWRVTVRRAW